MPANAQFTIRSLFIATTACAALVWALFSPPHWLGLIVLTIVYFTIPAIVAAGIVYHRGYLQSFFVGCAPAVAYFWLIHFGAGFPAFFDPWPFNFDVLLARTDNIMSAKLELASPLLVMIPSGFAAIGVRWWALTVARKKVVEGQSTSIH